jgi:hypothetical protein
MAYLEFFSPERLALQQEIMLDDHAALWPLLAKYPASEFEMRMAEVAAYCDVVLDGYYSQQELDKLCDILVKKLREKRTLVITTGISLH